MNGNAKLPGFVAASSFASFSAAAAHAANGKNNAAIRRTPPGKMEERHTRTQHLGLRLPANDVLERAIEDLLTRRHGRPSHASLVRYLSFRLLGHLG